MLPNRVSMPPCMTNKAPCQGQAVSVCQNFFAGSAAHPGGEQHYGRKSHGNWRGLHRLVGSRTLNATATKEVVLSAGSIQTTQLLFLSVYSFIVPVSSNVCLTPSGGIQGIGPQEMLEKAGIIKPYLANDKRRQDWPRLNTTHITHTHTHSLQDHTYFSLYVQVDPSIFASSLYHDISKLQQAEQEYSQQREGPLTAPVGLAYGFERIPTDTLRAIGAPTLASERLDQAHIEYYYETIYYPNIPDPAKPQLRVQHLVHQPDGRLSEPPLIDLTYYTHAEDRAVAVYAFKNLRKVLAEFARYGYTVGPHNGEVAPGPDAVQSDEEITEYVQNNAATRLACQRHVCHAPQG
ncbi:hypothetical protein B0H66DRAFT_595261 [Apodospora peruviana]|uniref:Uncharacterized protein n=1 Tax=Apodospora peruviana TaxID=516989 RepID=A0AAE0LYN2_9PEZI|nr:hypothetical protein B0H66DRAFT_595261 [Apodospora peruviana]